MEIYVLSLVIILCLFYQESVQLFGLGKYSQNPKNAMKGKYRLLKEEIAKEKELNQSWTAGLSQWRRMYRDKRFSDEEMAVLIYTGPGLYSKFNKLLRSWLKNPKLVFPFKNYFSLLNGRQVEKDKSFGCFRCETWLATFPLNKTIYADQFESCSTNINIAIGYCKGKSNTLFLISLPIHTNTSIPVIDTKGLSYNPKEEEFIIPPGVNFKVKSIIEPSAIHKYRIIWIAKK